MKAWDISLWLLGLESLSDRYGRPIAELVTEVMGIGRIAMQLVEVEKELILTNERIEMTSGALRRRGCVASNDLEAERENGCRCVVS